ncbi:hypothetical protein SKAU_G00256640 [Synaphobranchus kaupii]|uniref:Uncharacterized protein n=1 Tax=Synaphobranchus kaupii TaxID=118154 RepID=A0A9Q1F3X7_SYNKA|nr:hypothetical protein SKAU_G00256640 [Synaphobranchus kaupii]
MWTTPSGGAAPGQYRAYTTTQQHAKPSPLHLLVSNSRLRALLSPTGRERWPLHEDTEEGLHHFLHSQSVKLATLSAPSHKQQTANAEPGPRVNTMGRARGEERGGACRGRNATPPYRPAYLSSRALTSDTSIPDNAPVLRFSQRPTPRATVQFCVSDLGAISVILLYKVDFGTFGTSILLPRGFD